MSSKTPNKLVGGLLAGLLALFAAVVVATPAWATGGGSIYAGSGTYDLDAVFGAGNYTLSGTTTITLKKDATITVTDPVVFQTGSWILNMNGATLTNESTLSEWPGHGSVNNSLVQVQKDATLAINGEGTITGTGDTTHKLAALGVYGTCTVEGVALSGGGVNAGSDTIMPAVAVSGTGSSLSLGEDTEVSCAMSSVNGPAVAAQGGSSLTIDGAEITTTPETAGCAVMVGDDDESASLTMKSGTLNGNIGICVDANASVDVQGGTINLTGSNSSAGQDHLAAIYVQAASPATEANADINISDVNITGQAGNVICADNTISNLGSKASTSVDISGGDLNGGFSLGTGNNVDMKVSGGTYSAPVDPTWLADSVKVMSSNDDGQVSYYPSEADVPADETSTPVSNAPIQIMGKGLIGSDATASDTISTLLASLGLTESEIQKISAPTTGPNLWVVWYGANPTGASVSFSNGSAGATYTTTNTSNFKTQGQVGLAFVNLSNGITSAPAGTYKIQVANGANTQNTEVQVASLTTYNPSGDTVSSLSDSAPEGEAKTAYYNVSNEPLAEASQPTPTPGDNENAIAVGWYQLTPTTANGKTTYTAALWTEDEYVPNTATNTILMAAYTQPFQPGDITANLTIDPTNMLTVKNAGTATLTLTVGEDALNDASIVLAQPDDELNITNKSQLDVTMADLATSVANIAKAGLISSNIAFKVYSSSNWNTALYGTTSATLAEAPEGQSNPSINGATVTATLDLDMSKATGPTGAADGQVNPVAMTITLSALQLTGTMSGTNTAPVVSAQPAVTFNLYTGVQAATQGNGTFTQTVNADGTVTLTATPASGSTFVGWQAPLGTTIFSTPTITLSSAAVAQLNQTLTTSGGGTLLAVFQGGTSPSPEPPTPGSTIAVYRLYNTATQEHLLTSSTNEVSALTKGDWILDGYDANPSGIAFYALPNSESGVPVYRVYDYGTGTHMYTTSLHEVTTLVGRGWHWDNNEQPIFTTPTNSSYPVYRLYNPSLALNVSHLWTASWNEFNTLRNLTGSNKWDPEPNASGVAWFSCGVPTGPNQ